MRLINKDLMERARMMNCVIAISTLTALISGPASAKTFREQALLGIHAISCSSASEALGDSYEAAEFMKFGTFIVQRIYSNYELWQPQTPEHSTMPGIFTDMTQGSTPPLSESEMLDATYYTVTFLKDVQASDRARKGEGLDAGQLFKLERDQARETWVESRCAEIKEQYF